MNKCMHVILVLLGVAALTLPARAAEVAAYFTDGNDDTTYVDAYHGIAGAGWTGPWDEATLNGGTITAVVKESGDTGYNPIDGGGNYLNYLLTATQENSMGSVGRSYTDGIDVTADHSISFKFRIDEEDFASNFTDEEDPIHDVYSFFDYTSVRHGSTPGCRWQISGKPVALNSDTWKIVLSSEDKPDTGIGIVQGTVCDFQIDIRAATSKWDLTIDDGTTVFHSTDLYPDGMPFRSSASTVGGTVNFNAHASDATDARQFSIDDFKIVGTSNAPHGGMDTVAAHFTNGNDDTTYVDAYHGVAGDGWKRPWTDKVYDGAVTGHKVVLTTDTGFQEVTPGGGNYLSFSAADDGLEGTSAASVTRNYKTTADPGIDWSQKHTVEFTLRIDEDVDNEILFTDAQDKYFAVDCSSETARTSSTCTWQIGGASSELAPPDAAGWWNVYDGVAEANVDTGIALATGGVYDFTIVVDPTTQTYDMTIFDGTDTYDSTVANPDGLGWRSSATEVGGYLCFGAQNSGPEDTRAFSLDALVISQSLEPIPGDATNDGHVDELDAQRVAENWGATTQNLNYDTWWEMGDFDGDELVGPKDAAILAANWGYPGAEGVTDVPEPGTLMLLAIGLAIIGMRRLRR